MTVTAPPRPPLPSDPVTHEEFEALVEALIEEARHRAQRRRRRNAACASVVKPTAGSSSSTPGSGRTAPGRNERLIVATWRKRAGKRARPPTRATETTPSSSG